MELTDKIEKHFRLDGNQKKALKNLNLESISDLLFYFPTRYSDISQIKYIDSLVDGENATILGKVEKIEIKKSFKTRVAMSSATVSDITGSINIIWFNQAYLAKMFKQGSIVKVTGKVAIHKTYGLTLTNPEIESNDTLPIDLHDSLFSKEDISTKYGYPVYRETRGITSKWLYHAIHKILTKDCAKNIHEYIPKHILDKYKLPVLHNALVWIHMPQKKEHAEIARKRFAFEEVFFIQLQRQKERKEYDKLFSYKLKIDHKDIEGFTSRFPFTPTNAQNKVINTILKDFTLDKPMSRLLEGDVGSGKTFIAATVSYAVIKNRPVGQTYGNIQVAYMAPTEVLATQLFESFIQYFEHTGVSIALITGSGCRKYPSKSATWHDGVQDKTWTNISKNQLLKWIKNGEIPIVIGTHALISKNVEFEDLGLVIIDEQHRFGTNQRMKLAKKEGHAPHYLSMSATPIPRTLSLTIYGDLDLSILDEMPLGRKKVITAIVPPDKRENAYEKIQEELKKGRQLYVICPRIDEPNEDKKNSLQMKNVKSEADRLDKEVFPDYTIDIMHSKMSKDKKEEVMQDFKDHKTDILVSTSVIEVGVNVPNATCIIIEGAERFGLSQLHQLRGRVQRSSDQAYCYLFAEAKTTKTLERLRALEKTSDGFTLAELDLELRGSGVLSGDKQWGISDLGMEAIKNIKMVEAARNEAIDIIEKDENLSEYPTLALILSKHKQDLHFE